MGWIYSLWISCYGIDKDFDAIYKIISKESGVPLSLIEAFDEVVLAVTKLYSNEVVGLNFS